MSRLDEDITIKEIKIVIYTKYSAPGENSLCYAMFQHVPE